MGRNPLLRAAMLALAGVLALAEFAPPAPAMAQEDWKPFAEPERRRPPRAGTQPDTPRPPPLAPMDGHSDLRPTFERVAPGRSRDGPADTALRQPFQPLVERPTAIERSELPPIEGTTVAPPPGATSELWRGLDAAAFETHIAALELPVRSPVLTGLLQSMLTTDPGAAADEVRLKLLALRAEALHRAGFVADVARLQADIRTAQDGAVLAALAARARLAIGDADAGCPLVRATIVRRSELPPPLKSELTLLSGYCAAAAGQGSAAGLAADLAREEGVEAAFGLALLDVIAAGSKTHPVLPRAVTSTEYRLMQLAGMAASAQLVERATPALLAVLASAGDGPPRLRIMAAEAAARLGAIPPDQLAAAWRGEPFQAPELADPFAARVDAAARRALVFQAAERERNPARRTRLLRALADDARRAELAWPAFALMSPLIVPLAPVDEIAWFAETAVEVHLAAGHTEQARRWIAFAERSAAPGVGGGSLAHWLALADIADARLTAGQRGASLASVEALALRGRFTAHLLHRLATVLDALDYHVPIPLWEAASRSPQPSTGHLPATGVLSALQDAARTGEQGRSVLLTLQAVGPQGADGAHLIALGDAIRGLKRARLEADARRLALEALLMGWPRGGT